MRSGVGPASGTPGRRCRYRGVETALAYGPDPGTEHAAMLEGVAIVDSSWRREIVASGGDRLEFLQGQLSNDIAGLETGRGCPTLALNRQGRVVATLAAYRRPDDLLLVTDAAQLDATEPGEGFSLIGPAAPGLLRGAGYEAELERGSWSVSRGRLWGVEVRVLGRDDLSPPAFDLSLADPTEAGALASKLERAGAVWAGVEALERLRIESGTPLHGVDVDESRLAIEARLEWAIHFAKGCYLGQEVIERSVSRGRVNRLLSLLETEGEIAPGDGIEGGGESETVTSVSGCFDRRRLALAYLAVDRAGCGVDVDIVSSRGPVTARVLDWPREPVLPGREN
ncbi:MAG: YgfZ/GcvT domain-containing protein [Candidatus Binatia bacterium]